MLPVVEDLIAGVLQDRLKFLQSNVDIVDRIFPQSTVTTRTRLKSYLQSNAIQILRGFPRDASSLPAWVIMLGGEGEVQQTLGNYLGEDDTNIVTDTVTETQQILTHEGLCIVQLQHKPLLAVNSITYNGDVYTDDFVELDEDRAIVQLEFPVDLSVADTVQVNYTYEVSGTDTFGAFFRSQYRVETWTNNGDLTVLMYHLSKWALLSARDSLTEQGLVMQSLGGMDFEPAPEYLPEFVYRRALTFECTTEVSYDATFGFIQSIDVRGTIGGVQEG